MKPVREITPSDLSELFTHDEPRVVRSAIDPAMLEHFDVESLSAEFGPTPVQVATTEDGLFRGDARRGAYHGEQMVETPFDDALRELIDQKNPRTYLPRVDLKLAPALLSRLPFASVRGPDQLVLAALWIGPEGNRMALHHDFASNMFVQLIGAKRFVLVSPAFELHEVRLPVRRFGDRTCWHGTGVPDVVALAEEGSTTLTSDDLYATTLDPGDVLWLPNLWWHEVTARSSPTVSASSWWSTASMDSIQSAVLAVTRDGERLGGLPTDWRTRVEVVDGRSIEV